MANNLNKAMRYQVYVSSFRKRKTFLDILTPKQTLLYKNWFLSNRERCNQALDEQRRDSTLLTASTVVRGVANSVGDKNLTLEALCLNLEEILRISKVSTSEAPAPDDSELKREQLDFVI
jgi:hypothetical protein